jgi:hypothetical protein
MLTYAGVAKSFLHVDGMNRCRFETHVLNAAYESPRESLKESRKESLKESLTL